jgi:hypothetical protein
MAKATVSALDEARYRAVSIVARNAKTGGLLAEKYGYRSGATSQRPGVIRGATLDPRRL